jgi:hypothetical protein
MTQLHLAQHSSLTRGYVRIIGDTVSYRGSSLDLKPVRSDQPGIEFCRISVSIDRHLRARRVDKIHHSSPRLRHDKEPYFRNSTRVQMTRDTGISTSIFMRCATTFDRRGIPICDKTMGKEKGNSVSAAPIRTPAGRKDCQLPSQDQPLVGDIDPDSAP